MSELEERTGLTPDVDNMNINTGSRRIIDVEDALLDMDDMDDHGKDESARTKDLINLTAHMLDLLPARVRKPCADMLLMWESDKGDFLVFVVFLCKVVIQMRSVS